LALFAEWVLVMAVIVPRAPAFWLVVSVVSGALVLALAVGCTRRANSSQGLQIAAHRGGAAVAPENTLAAARRAIADGCDWLEVDVQESRDGEVLVVHDEDLQRVSGRDLKIWEHDAAELQQIDVGSWFAPQFKDVRIPTLGQLLDVCRGKIGVLLELKHRGHAQRLEERIAEIVGRHGMEGQVMAMSFDEASVRRMKALRPDWKVGWITREPVADPRTIMADFLAIHHEQAAPHVFQIAHHRQMPVYVWTVNDPALAASLAERGADMLISDNPRTLREALSQRP
jgi:glycerophosphoryl diester phosphodiesterase